MNPIYIEIDTITDNEVKRIQDVTGRIVVLTFKPPDQCILDTQESLRDKFAGQALQKFAEWLPSRPEDIGWTSSEKENHYESIAYVCYKFADALIKQREVRNG